ncbi:metalloprotease family protein [Natrinema thermotolerans]|uniref:Metalloprotease family protein n=1 Tax=Natrinema thermotolerans TaxID=121872 RepID=A0AAF0T422_9EURY|nr:metalloprotease family protein [Natrinema thermotolerans]QCC59112.1 DUF3267 domain-containing protein [Natrinema thermotolerans]WMT06064.1 metalloprotease family protein [Natrinema thermotolerans]
MNPETVTYVLAAVVAVAVLATVLLGIGALVRLLLRLLAAPGVVVHELAHETACRLVGVPVLEVAYFRLGNPPGYVRHGQPERYRESFVISVAPFLVNSAVAFGLFVGLASIVAGLDAVGSAPRSTLAAGVVLGWLGLAIGTQAFPSTGDARTLWNRSRAEWRRSPSVLVGVPIVAVIYLANLLSRLWADVAYAVALFVAAAWSVGLV